MTNRANSIVSARSYQNRGDKITLVRGAIKESWRTVAPAWPLKNIVAANPLMGFTHLPFDEALGQGTLLFGRRFPQPMEAINRLCIKWFQVYFDEGQATIPMPHRELGLYRAWRHLAQWDAELAGGRPLPVSDLSALPDCPEAALVRCLDLLGVEEHEYKTFLMLMVSSLSGWASHVAYRVGWCSADEGEHRLVSEADFLAVRVASTMLLWPEARSILDWHASSTASRKRVALSLRSMEHAEQSYRAGLISKLREVIPPQLTSPKLAPDVQAVFCIDVRSEPFRRAFEAVGRHETFGFAGFFGLPIRLKHRRTNKSYASCPVLLTPQYQALQQPAHHHGCDDGDRACGHDHSIAERVYQGLKYTFVTPFGLAEAHGPFAGGWMAVKTLAPRLAKWIAKRSGAHRHTNPADESIYHDIPFLEQCRLAEQALRMIGLTSGFAPLVLLCGHGSTTTNNAFATALDCGACGGRHGGPNARVLVSILNSDEVRAALALNGIAIPRTTRFIAGQHDTVTDDVALYVDGDVDEVVQDKIERLKVSLQEASRRNRMTRSRQLPCQGLKRSDVAVSDRSIDWAQVRPEWGLARNAALIVGPRWLTRTVDLEGRCFLHSYDWDQDPRGESLTTILTAPMVVAHWINSQYLFSTLDNRVYGAGSKVTKNVTGKLGVIQGNGSDLMTGLPLQSVYRNDAERFHEPQRLLTVVYAPPDRVRQIVQSHDGVRQLVQNGWIHLECIDPVDGVAHTIA